MITALRDQARAASRRAELAGQQRAGAYSRRQISCCLTKSPTTRWVPSRSSRSGWAHRQCVGWTAWPITDSGSPVKSGRPTSYESVKSRFLCSGLAPVPVLHPREGFHAALDREGRPPALANAPCSRDRSCLIGCTRKISPPAETSTVSPTIATWT